MPAASPTGFFRRQDAYALAAVIAAAAAICAYRAAYIEPRAWGAACAAASHAQPLACTPRAWLLLLQRYYLLGIAALVLGAWGFFRPRALLVQTLACATGVAAMANYNASYGAAGIGLALLGWVSARARGQRPA